MPTVILVATVTTIIGAGSHLIANDLLFHIADQRISFAQWTLWVRRSESSPATPPRG